MEDRIEVSKQKDTKHTRFEAWYGSVHHNVYARLDTRRVLRAGTDEAQIEVSLSATPIGGKRTSTLHASVVLNPEQARELALSICPELAPK